MNALMAIGYVFTWVAPFIVIAVGLLPILNRVAYGSSSSDEFVLLTLIVLPAGLLMLYLRCGGKP